MNLRTRKRTDLQSVAFGRVAIPPKFDDPYGIRTRDTAVKGRCLNHLNKGPLLYFILLLGLSELESPTSPLSGVRSNQLSYRPVLKWKAGEENRTPDNSLEGCSFTTKLHPHIYDPDRI